MKKNKAEEAALQFAHDFEELLIQVDTRKRTSIYKSILDAVEEKTGKKIIGYGTLEFPRIFSNDLEKLLKMIQHYKNSPPAFMLITFENESQIGVLNGREIVPATVYLSLKKKIKEAVKSAILKSPYGITNDEIDEIVPIFLSAGIDPVTCQPYLSDVEKQLLKKLNIPYRAKNFRYIARFVKNKEITYIDDPTRGRLYLPPKKD